MKTRIILQLSEFMFIATFSTAVQLMSHHFSHIRIVSQVMRYRLVHYHHACQRVLPSYMSPTSFMSFMMIMEQAIWFIIRI